RSLRRTRKGPLRRVNKSNDRHLSRSQCRYSRFSRHCERGLFMRFSGRVIAGSLLGLLLASTTIVPANAQANAPSAIDFGDDSSPWAKDGECDDPRFEAEGASEDVDDAELMKDATDCSAAFGAGTATLKTDTPPAPPKSTSAAPSGSAAEIDFGDDSSQWAKDGECDDPRFTGTGAAAELVDEDRLKDATDCRAAYE